MSMQTDSAFSGATAKPVTQFYLSVLRAGALLGIAATIARFWAQTNWVADLVSQLLVQWAFGLLVLVLLFALARRWWWGLICLIGFSINAIPIWPYVAGAVGFSDPPAVVAADSTKQFRLMSLNLLTRNRNWEAVIESIRDASPDFLVLMEVDSVWQQICQSDLADEYPHVKFDAREDNFGIAFFSKVPWSRLEVLDSQTLRLPSIDVTFANLSEKPLRIIATHPIPPISQRNWKARNQQLTNVAQRFDETTSNLMVGDFNLSPWSPNFKKTLAAGNLRDASRPFGPTPTWYVFPTWIGGLKIDHALVSQEILVDDLEVGQDVGSDHRALVLDFRY